MSRECGTGYQTGLGDNREVSSPCGKILMLWYISDTLSGGAQGAGSPLNEEEAEPGCQNACRGESPIEEDMVQHGQLREAKPSREMAVASGRRALCSSMPLWVTLARASLQELAG